MYQNFACGAIIHNVNKHNTYQQLFVGVTLRAAVAVSSLAPSIHF